MKRDLILRRDGRSLAAEKLIKMFFPILKILHLFVVDVDLVTTDLEKVLHRSGVFCVQHAFLVCEVCQSVPGKSFFLMQQIIL